VENIVIKANGLANGRGVVLPNTIEGAVSSLSDMMREHVFGDAGLTVVIQERLYGPEVSVMAISDGKTVVPLLPAQDHKRIFDGDTGPNTGGMGAYAPVPLVTPGLLDEIHRTILQPTVDGMSNEGHPFKGVLYAGLMLTKDGPKVLEFNVRFGDPETEAVLPLLEGDIVPAFHDIAKGNMIFNRNFPHKSGSCVVVALAAAGYPEVPETGREIHGLHTVSCQKDVIVFHGATTRHNGSTYSSGGRVLMVTGLGATVEEAGVRAYGAIGDGGISFGGMQYRRDIVEYR